MRDARELEHGCDEQVESHMRAFDVAREVSGWDWEADREFAAWVLKATEEESLAHGLRCALRALAGGGQS